MQLPEEGGGQGAGEGRSEAVLPEERTIHPHGCTAVSDLPVLPLHALPLQHLEHDALNTGVLPRCVSVTFCLTGD